MACAVACFSQVLIPHLARTIYVQPEIEFTYMNGHPGNSCLHGWFPYDPSCHRRLKRNYTEKSSR